MSCPNESFSASSAFHPMSTTDIEPRTYPAYSDPFRVTAASPFQRVNHGLGITYCETKPSASHMQDFQSSEHYAPDWADQLMPSALHYGCGHNNNNNNNHISPIAFYERYPGSDASVSPLSHCVPRAISVSPSRGSALEFQAAPEAMNMQAYNFLPNTPHSDTDVIIKEDPDAELHAEFQDGLYLECTKPVSMPLFAPVAQYRTTDFWPKLECPEEDDFSEPTVIDRDGEPSLSAESSVFSVGTNSPWIGGDNALLYHEQIKVPPASGTECGICGAKFTRRSNCREHMKRHDPSNRKSYTCETCGKALGRKTDLKRHIDSVCISPPSVCQLLLMSKRSIEEFEGLHAINVVPASVDRIPLQDTVQTDADETADDLSTNHHERLLTKPDTQKRRNKYPDKQNTRFCSAFILLLFLGVSIVHS